MLHRVLRASKIAAALAAAASAFACGEPKVLPIIYIDAGRMPPPVYFEDASVDAGVPQPMPDAGIGPSVQVSGTVTKLDTYLAGMPTTVSNVVLTAYGVTGVPPATSLDTGQYVMRIPQDGYALLRGTKDTYYPTSEVLEVRNYDVVKNLYIATVGYVDMIAAAYNVDINTPFACHAPNNTADQCRYAIIMGRIVDDGTEGAGVPTPVAGVAKEEFKVVALGRDDWYKKGPYFLGTTGTPNATYTTSQRVRDPVDNRYKGGLYVVFVEIPAQGYPERDFTITAASTTGGAIYRYFGPTNVKVARQTLAWASIPETGQGMPPPEPPPLPVNIDFDTQIYPLFLPLNQGGLGCHGCHTNQIGVPEGGMNLYGLDAAYQALDPANYPGRTNVQNPALSLLLLRPLYEAGVQDHPIYAFSDINDPNYKTVYAWIAEGGKRLTPQPPLQVSYYNEIRPMLYRPTDQGGIGCYQCHVNGVNANNAPGNFYMGGDGNELYAELTAEVPANAGTTAEPYRINKQANYVGRSLILVKPLVGSNENHDVKIFYGADDPRYQKIYTWIQQGYVNDTP